MWTDQLLGEPGNFTPILQTLTTADGECLQAVLTILLSHAAATESTLTNYIQDGICVDMSEQMGAQINQHSLATLKAIGLVLKPDNSHVGLTPLAFGFLQAMGAI